MRNRVVCAFAIGALLVATGCQQGAAPGRTQDRAAEMGKINELREAFAAAFNAGDAAAIAEFYTENGVWMPSHEAAVRGKPAILGWYQKAFQEASFQITITPEETEIAGDWAFERGAAAMTVKPKGAKGPVEQSGKYLVILRRQADGNWKIHTDIDNSNEALPAAGAAAKGRER